MMTLNLQKHSELKKWTMMCNFKVSTFGDDDSALVRCFDALVELSKRFENGRIKQANLYIERNKVLKAAPEHDVVLKRPAATAPAAEVAPEQKSRRLLGKTEDPNIAKTAAPKIAKTADPKIAKTAGPEIAKKPAAATRAAAKQVRKKPAAATADGHEIDEPDEPRERGAWRVSRLASTPPPPPPPTEPPPPPPPTPPNKSTGRAERVLSPAGGAAP